MKAKSFRTRFPLHSKCFNCKLIFLFAVLCLHSVSGEEPGSLDTPRQVQFREPQQTHYTLVEFTNKASPESIRSSAVPSPEWIQAHFGDSTNFVEMSSRIVLQVKPGTNIEHLLNGQNLALSRTIDSNLFILQASSGAAAIDAAESLAKEPDVVASYPVMRRSFRRQSTYAKAPNDPRFGEQWHLENRGNDYNLLGPDLNVRAAWTERHGENVLVAVADDGFQLDHPELTERARNGPHYNFFQDRANGAPTSSNAIHATAVAGLISAESENNRGVAGVAPQAQLANWVIFGNSYFGRESIATDEQLMDMFQFASNRVSVQNHSWGNASTAQIPLDTLADTGIANAVNQGRNGRGVVMVRAGGNSRSSLNNVNDDAFANDPRVIAVAAIRKDGRACGYSNPGACILVAAPSGDVIDQNGDGEPDSFDPEAPDVLTTDRTGSAGYNLDRDVSGDYTSFNGTSASSPQVAGIVALILSANPALTYRDAQQILVHSSRHYDVTDPDVRLNGAGFQFSHNVGFGVPDAGFALELAKVWSNSPPIKSILITNRVETPIPEDSLRVVCTGSGIPNSIKSIRCLPSLGPHPDEPSAALPLVYIGQANEEITQDLHGKGALIQRGTSFFSEKIARAARAGAAFAIIFNNVGTTELQAMGGTDYVSIPAVSIGKTDGETLRDFIARNPQMSAQLQLHPAVYRFSVNDTLRCEHIGVRVKTTHTSRSDLRITLVSPMGTRSVLQALNADFSAGPTDWTYWSVQHFYESSAGEWRLELSDERNTTVRTFPSGTKPATGSVTYAQLIIKGIPIIDHDHDALDDDWELKWFGNLNFGPKDDPDKDGYNNGREQVLSTRPTTPNSVFKLNVTELAAGKWRLSWPGRYGETFTLQSGADLTDPLADRAVVMGHFPITEHVLSESQPLMQFFRVQNDNEFRSSHSTASKQ